MAVGSDTGTRTMGLLPPKKLIDKNIETWIKVKKKISLFQAVKSLPHWNVINSSLQFTKQI